MGIAIGIDLGTTNSCVAVVQGGRARVLEDRAARRVHPSIVSFLPGGETVAGHAARDRQIDDPKNTIHSSKRLIGRSFHSEEMQQVLKELPYDVLAGPDDVPVVRVHNKEVSLPEISALILRHLKNMCTVTLGMDISEAVITVPASFDDVQRSSTKVAGRIAGFNVLRILNEPTAAALAYGIGGKRRERVAVYDFGGGTFDITVVELSDDIFEVLSTAGDTYLGGDDFDRTIQQEMVAQFKREHRVDLSENPGTMQRVRSVAERVKCQLSSLDKVQATLRNMAQSSRGDIVDFSFQIDRRRFNQLITPFVERSLNVCDEALKLAGILRSDLDSLVMVGGTTRIPLVRQMVAEHFGVTPRTEINPDEVVAIGAAIQAYSLTGEQLPEVFPKPLALIKKEKRTMVGFTAAAGSAGPAVAGTSPPRIKRTLPIASHPVEDAGGTASAEKKAKSTIPLKKTRPTPQPFDLEARAQPPSTALPATTSPSLAEADRRTGGDALALDVKRGAGVALPPELGLQVKRPAVSEEVMKVDFHRDWMTPDEMGLDVKHSAGEDPLALDVKQGITPMEEFGLDIKRPPAEDALALDVKRAPTFPDEMGLDVKHHLDEDLGLAVKRSRSDSLELDLRRNAPVDTALELNPRGGPSPGMDLEPKSGAPVDTALELDVRRSLDEVFGRITSKPPIPLSDEDFAGLETFSEPPDGSDPPEPVARTRQTPLGSAPAKNIFNRDIDEVAAAPGTAMPSRAPVDGQVSSTVSIPSVSANKGALLLDVTPRALGVAVAGGYCDIIIERNAAIPLDQSRRFTTSTDNQTEVSIDIYQGESRRIADNTKLGQVVLSNIRPAMRGAIKILVTFEIDTDGILGVFAVNEETREAQSTRIVLSGGMDEAKVQALVEKYAER